MSNNLVFINLHNYTSQKLGCILEATDLEGNTVVQLAFRNGRSDIVECLIAHGALDTR